MTSKALTIKPADLPVEKNSRGRPTKYCPEMCQDLIEFFDRPVYKYEKEEKIVDGKVVEIKRKVPNDTPFIVHWARKNKISIMTPSIWAHKIPEFAEAMQEAKALQEAFLVELGVKGDHNGFMTFQTLKNVAGWRDKTEIEHGANGTLADLFRNAKNGNNASTDKKSDG